MALSNRFRKQQTLISPRGLRLITEREVFYELIDRTGFTAYGPLRRALRVMRGEKE